MVVVVVAVAVAVVVAINMFCFCYWVWILYVRGHPGLSMKKQCTVSQPMEILIWKTFETIVPIFSGHIDFQTKPPNILDDQASALPRWSEGRGHATVIWLRVMSPFFPLTKTVLWLCLKMGYAETWWLEYSSCSDPYWSGWWFGKCFYFPYIENNWLIFFRGVETTNQW
jgi:hypothetical protein